MTYLSNPSQSKGSGYHIHKDMEGSLVQEKGKDPNQDVIFSDDSIADLMFHRLDLILPTPLLAGQSPKLCEYFKRLSVQGWFLFLLFF